MNTHQHIKRMLLLSAYVLTVIFSNLQAQGIGPDSTQLIAFEAFNSGHGYQVYWNTNTGTPEAIFGANTQQRLHIPGASGLSPENVARIFLIQHRDIFRMTANLENLEIVRIRSSNGIAHIRFQQTYEDIPIVGGEYFVHVNETDKGMHKALISIENDLPFPILGFDSDNGTEFLNWHIYRYLTGRSTPVQFTRSRPYKKNDNAHIAFISRIGRIKVS